MHALSEGRLLAFERCGREVGELGATREAAAAFAG
jgi:hypothetical protein